VLAGLALAAPPLAQARPARVFDLRASAATTSVKLSWRYRDRRARYQVRYRRLVGRRQVLGLGRTRAYTKRGLAPATTYFFEVRACRGRTCSLWSRPLRSRTTAGASLPPAERPVQPPTGSGPSVVGPGPSVVGPGAAACRVFPPDNPWNRDISGDPVDSNSGNYIASIGALTKLHPDFGSDPTYGIPYTVVWSGQARVPINFTDYGDESDPGPYPIPRGAPVEGGASSDGDRHVLVVDTAACRLYELYRAFPNADGSWNAGSGAAFDLNSNALRPETWTSADAAGLPIFPGLIRYDEVQSGAINHAIRFTVQRSQRGYIHPATHFASSSSDPNLPPMGLRVRLKASFDISGYPRDAQVILTAMKKYGLIVADNGSNWYFGGATDARWNDDELNPLKNVPGSAFEAVQSGPIVHG
jgi:hypothetical protein